MGVKIECTNCNKPFNSSMRACPFCGAEKKNDTIKTPGECPRCKLPLQEIIFRNEVIDICSECDGLWLDSSEFAKLTSFRDTLDDQSIPFDYTKPALEQFTSYIPCPRCKKLMSRENFRRISGVIIDRCIDHGVWFDAAELDKIRNFVANDGISRSHDTVLEKHDIEINTLKTKVSDIELMEKILHKWEKKRFRFRKF